MAKPSAKRSVVSIELPRSESAEEYVSRLRASNTVSPSSQYAGLEGKLEDLDKRSLRLHTSASQYSRTESPYVSMVDEKSLKESLSKRSFVQQKMTSLHTALGEEIRLNQEMDRENVLLRKECDSLRRELLHLHALVDELDHAKIDLETRNLSLATQLSEAHAAISESERNTGSEYVDEEEMLQYVAFLGNKLEDIPELSLLFKGRIVSVGELREKVVEGKYAEGLLKSLQIMSDFVVYFSRKKNARISETPSKRVSPPPAPVPSESPQKTQSTQTLTDRSMGASLHIHSPSFTHESLFRSESRIRTSSFEPKTHISNTLMTEESLEEPRKPAVTSEFGDRLARLNQQIYETMASSKRLLSAPSKTFLLQSMRSAGSTPNLLSVSKDQTSSRYGISVHPPKEESAELTEKIRRAELSMKDELRPEEESLLKPAEETLKPRTRSPSAFSSRPIKGKHVQDKAVPVLWKTDGWSSVSEYFSGESDPKKKKKDEGEQIEGQQPRYS